MQSKPVPPAGIALAVIVLLVLIWGLYRHFMVPPEPVGAPPLPGMNLPGAPGAARKQ